VISAAVPSAHSISEFELCFDSLFGNGKGFAFPCDAKGQVDFDAVGQRVRNNYLFARALIGRDYATPVVRRRK
jgi:hypothetical protein